MLKSLIVISCMVVSFFGEIGGKALKPINLYGHSTGLETTLRIAPRVPLSSPDGNYQTARLTIKNTTNKPISIDNIKLIYYWIGIIDHDLSNNVCLPPGERHTYFITFQGKKRGEYNVSFTIYYSEGC